MTRAIAKPDEHVVVPPKSAAPPTPAPVASDPLRETDGRGLSKNKRAILRALQAIGKPATTGEIGEMATNLDDTVKRISIPAEIARLRHLEVPLLQPVGFNDRKYPLYALTPKGQQEVAAM